LETLLERGDSSYMFSSVIHLDFTGQE